MIRKAGALIVGRDSSKGLELLVLERSAASRFLPGYVAFPGGAVEPQDAPLAERWFGNPEQAARACAVRELMEEVGLGLTGAGVVNGFGPGDSSVEKIDAQPPSAAQLPQIAHWVAPEEVPVRFDALYFSAEADAQIEPQPDGVEIAKAWWITPRELLDGWEHREVKLYWPTYFTVRELAGCENVRDLLSKRIETRGPDDHELEYLHRSTFWQE